MKKLIYQSPFIHLNNIRMEESLASSSANTYYASPDEQSIFLEDYNEIEESEKDLNINF